MAVLRTLSEVGRKIFNISVVVSVTALLIGRPEYADMWKVMVPFGIFCWFVGVAAESQRLKLIAK
jgi:hypothetical protein